jgi:thiopurine S-methyltransferase
VDHAFWRSRWQEGRTRFHEGHPNTYLSKHADWLTECRRVLVPLCGKTEDLAFLASVGHDVVGVEFVEDAVRQFFVEHQTTPTVKVGDGVSIYSAGAVTIIAGDFFATTAAIVGPIDGIYDRAALIALPPDLRARYARHVRAIALQAKRELLITLEYPAGSYNGPPFSVDEAEVRALFAGADVQLIDEGLDPDDRGNGKWIERCYTIRYSG